MRRAAPLVGLTLAAAALRFAALGSQSFWADEAATARLMQLGLWPMLRGVAHGESTPPLYYVLAWLWTRVAGVSEVGLRSLSALLGTLMVPAVYAAAARLLDRRAAIAAAAVTAFSPLLVWYSQEARSYALLGLLAALSLWALPDALDPAAPARRLWRWALIAALALATHYFAVFLVVPEGVAIALRRGRPTRAPLAAVVLLALALAPLALTQRAHGTAHFIADSALGTRVLQIPKQLLDGYAAPAATALLLCALVLAAVALWFGWRACDARVRVVSVRLGGLGAIAIALPLLLALAGLDYLITRNVIAAWVPLALAVALPASRGGRPAYAALAGFCAVGLAVTAGIAANAAYQRDNWRAIARAVPAASGGPTVLVATPASGVPVLRYYLPHAASVPANGRVTVDTIVVAALAARRPGTGARPAPTAVPWPSLGGFEPAVVRHESTYELVTYRVSGAPESLTSQQLAGLALAAGPPAELLVP